MEAQEIFSQMCSIIEKETGEISPASYRVWISTLRPLVFKNNVLFLVTPSELHRNHVLKSNDGLYRTYLVTALNMVVDTPGADIRLVLENEAAELLDRGQVNPTVLQHPMLNEKYTFDNFVIGPSNMFAHAAALSVAEAPATINNPLFIYGGVGLGKTHLMHAIGNYILGKDSHAKVLYCTCERFTNEFIDALAKHQVSAFRERYRENVDVLMIDDIQFLQKTVAVQEEMFNTINDLFSANKQIVLASDRHPRNIPALADRLRSRFEGGLIVDITLPDLETRAAILRKKADAEHMVVSDSVLAMIAERASDNVRELEGALKRIIALSGIKGQPITLELTQEALKDYHNEVQQHCTPETIINAVAKYFNIAPEDIIGSKRDKQIVLPRHIAFYLCRELTDLSTSRLGDEFGGRDHSTMINGIGKIRNAIKSDSVIDNYVQDIQMRLQGE